jgi:hypothetical protein
MMHAAQPIHDWRSRWLRGLLAIALGGLIWLVVLPWLGARAPVRQHVDALHAAGINASAMFYSELECQQWLQR